MTNLFGLGHIAQLHEIQSARLKRNQPGIGPEVEELIRRLTDGGVLLDKTDERTRQAKVLWDLGFGRELGFNKFEDYLDTIPKDVPENDRPDLFDRLMLVDRRLKVVKTKKLLGLDDRLGYDRMVKDFYGRKYPDTEFIWCQDGRRNRNKSTSVCRESFVKGVEIGMTAIEGLCLHAQERTVTAVPDSHLIDLPGSVDASESDRTAYLGRVDGEVELRWASDDDAYPDHGSASRRA